MYISGLKWNKFRNVIIFMFIKTTKVACLLLACMLKENTTCKTLDCATRLRSDFLNIPVLIYEYWGYWSFQQYRVLRRHGPYTLKAQ